MKNISKKIIATLLAVTMLLSVTACSKDKDTNSNVDLDSNNISIHSDSTSNAPNSNTSKNPTDDKSESKSESKSDSKSNSSSKDNQTSTNDQKWKTPSEIQTGMLKEMVAFDKLMNEQKKKQSCMVGYLHIPNTTISDVVVQGDDNEYFLRRNKYQESNFNGCYYADFRNYFDAKNPLSGNSIIYGHSMDDNKNGGMFSQLKKYTDIDFAKNNQFIYFSTPEKEMVWQIFAVFYTNVSEEALNKFYYIETDPRTTEFNNLIATAKKKSLYNYEDVVVTPMDNILTLSTCTYRFSEKFEYPNDYRYVVMAKLLPKGAKPTLSKVSENKNVELPGKLYGEKISNK